MYSAVRYSRVQYSAFQDKAEQLHTTQHLPSTPNTVPFDDTVKHSAVQWSNHHITSHHTTNNTEMTAQYNITAGYTILYYTTLHYTTLQCTIHYCTFHGDIFVIALSALCRVALKMKRHPQMHAP